MEKGKIRLLIMSRANGADETIVFTRDEIVPGDDYLCPGQSIDFDGVIFADLPMSFPTDVWLVKS